jgi:hypothetical protein
LYIPGTSDKSSLLNKGSLYIFIANFDTALEYPYGQKVDSVRTYIVSSMMAFTTVGKERGQGVNAREKRNGKRKKK